jgi:DNA (cytosine-5)-methyltransferase 1
VKAISLFSGIGGLDYGFLEAGIDTVLQVENDPWCRRVLEHHWPEVERRGDVREIDARTFCRGGRHLAGTGPGADAERVRHGWRDEVNKTVDLVYGGFPCQDVSVAGKRAGLSGERSSLWFEFERIVSILRPRWVVIENVPGLLSSGSQSGADFGVVLRGLVELGYGVAWRILDARFFGVPQRRRRVFVVGCAGDAPRAAQVLAVCESCGGHPPTRGETGQDIAFTLDGGARGTSCDLPMTAYALPASARGTGDGHGNAWNTTYLPVGSRLDGGMARPLVARESGYRMDLESETFVVSAPIRASDGHHGWSGGRGDGTDNPVAQTLSSSYVKTTASGGRHGSQRPVNVVVHGAEGVRRLTPLECERLQGFPDDWTGVHVDGRLIADAHRYRMLGNAVATPCAQWLGHRLAWADVRH